VIIDQVRQMLLYCSLSVIEVRFAQYRCGSERYAQPAHTLLPCA